MPNNVLVVEDNPVILKLVSEILKKQGYSVRTALDGLSALNIIEQYTPDIIFTDLLIPKIDGEMLCKIIRSKAQLEQTYLIVLSGIATEVGINYDSLGVDACIAKGKNIRTHIVEVLNKIEKGELRGEDSRTYGFEDVFARDATVGLLDSKKHLEVILDNLSEGLVEVTAEGIIIFANSAAELLLSASQDQLLGRNFFDFFEKEGKAQAMGLFANVLQGSLQVSESTEPLFLEKRYLNIRICALEKITRPRCIIIMHNITERKKIEEEREGLVKDLRNSLENVKILSGLLPICSKCKKIRDDQGYWKNLELYLQEHADILFTHSMCVDCVEELYGDEPWYFKKKDRTTGNEK